MEEKRRRIQDLKNIKKDVNKIQQNFQLSIDENSSLNQLKVLEKFEPDTDNNSKHILKELNIDLESINSIRNSFHKVKSLLFFFSWVSFNILTKSLSKLETKRDNLIESINNLAKEIKSMWHRFETRNDKVATFLDKNMTYNQGTLSMLKQEHQRCVALKSSKLWHLIEKTREEIRLVWAENCLGKRELDTFEPKLRQCKSSYFSHKVSQFLWKIFLWKI